MKRIKNCNFGRIMLRIFCWSTVVLSVYLLLGFFGCYENWFGGPAGITEQTVYWLVRLGIVCGWIPIAHLIMLHIIIKTVGNEVKMEKMRNERNQ